MKLGSYELLREQGGIGAGTAWLARAESDTAETPKLFSVVRVHKHLLKKPEIAETFLSEVKPALGFTHANVSALLEAKSEGGELYTVSELHEGVPLSALTTAAGAPGLPQPVVLRIMLDVLSALSAAHAHAPGVFHGELGPHQVIVGTDGVSRVTGLGAARAFARISAPLGPKNQERLAYAAPERVKAMSTPGGAASAPAPDAPADLFSVGVMLWEGISRQRLFASKIDAAIVQKVLSGPIAPLATAAELNAAVQAALERDPGKRTATASALITTIEGLGGDTVASAKDVAAQVEKLAGKAIAAFRAEATKPAAKPLGAAVKPAEAPKPAAPKPAEASTPKPAEAAAPKPAEASTPKPAEAGSRPSDSSAPTIPVAAKLAVPRKATLLGVPAPVIAPKPATPAPAAAKPADAAPSSKPVTMGETPKPPAQPDPAPTSVPKPDSKPVTMGETPKPPAQPASTPKPAVAEAKPQPRVDEGLDDEDKVPIEIEEEPEPAKAAPPLKKAPPPPAAAKRTLLMGTPSPALKQAIKASDPKAEAAKPAPPKPAAAAQLDTAGGKTAHTPASAERSPGAKSRGAGTEKVGPGSTLGRYEILMPVARGGMASVWAARLPGSRGFQKIFAVKTMLPDVSDDPEFENMFLDEGRVAARIRHPNVVEIIDLGEQEAVLYLVMEWVDGENLGSIVKAARAQGGVPLPIVLKLASQIAAGLHAAHELRDDDGNLVDLVHRDVSPANVLVTSTGFVKIVDFGIAKSKGRLHQTRVGGVVKGKTPYLSPEQLGQLPIDRRSDIFSFGVLLYVLTTGLHPFRGETDAKTIENIALREPVPLHNIVPSTPPEFEAVVLKALAKEPKERYATAAEMQRAVDQAAAAVGITTTEEDVAAFVKQVLGDVLTKRAQELRSAIDRADGRAPPPAEAQPEPAPTAKPPPPEEAEEGGKPQQAITLHEITLDEVPSKKPGDTEPKKDDALEPVAAKAPIEDEVSFEEEQKPAAKPPLPGRKDVTAEASAFDLSPAPLLAVPPPPPPLEDEASLAPAAPPVEPKREAASSDGGATEAPLELDEMPRRRKPVALIAVGAALGLCAIIGGIALFGGGGGDAKGGKRPAATAAATATATAAPPPTPTQAAAPAPTPTETAAPTPAPTETAAPAPAETTPPAETAKAPTTPVKQGGGTRTPPPSGKARTPPPNKSKQNNSKYNPPGI